MVQSASAAGTADAPSPSLSVTLDLVSGHLTLAGPLDRDSIHRFRDAIVTLLVCDCRWWTFDLTELSTCDRAGLHALVGASRWAVRHDRRAVLVGTPPWLQAKLIGADRTTFASATAGPRSRVPI